MTLQIDVKSEHRHETPQINGVSKEIDCLGNLDMWPQINSEEGFNTHLWGFQGDRWENIHFTIKPRHVTPQIDHLWKTEPHF